MRLLLVEDDRDLSLALVHILQREGYEVDAVFDGAAGKRYAEGGSYDALIFDVMLPEMDGFSAVEALREAGIDTPVLMLTAKRTIPDKIEGLDSGADSYMTKPFSPRELLARIRALTRRHVPESGDTVHLGDLSLSSLSHSLSFGDESLQLCNKEYLLAKLLMEQPSMVLTKQQIVEAVWEGEEEVKRNSIEAFVSMLRKKLKFLGTPYRIESERGVGYKLITDEAAEAHAGAESEGEGADHS